MKDCKAMFQGSFSPDLAGQVAEQRRQDALRDAAQARLRRAAEGPSDFAIVRLSRAARLAVGGAMIQLGGLIAGRAHWQPAEPVVSPDASFELAR
jgi:hypothetical protein